MKTIALYQVDAFTDRLFAGNPAAVCPLAEWLPDHVMQSIAAENNLSETAFFVPHGDGFELRWFTTSGEINLCGHATLASAHVLFEHLNYEKPNISFTTRFVGPLGVTRQGGWLTLDFPSWPAPAVDAPTSRIEGLGGPAPQECYLKRDYMFVYANEETVRGLKPDFGALRKLERRNLCITAPGANCDFVSRFFCPGDVPEEDPVTGSAHSMLIPYWAKRLGKTKLFARQLSERGGELCCELQGERVLIAGQARTFMQGKIFLPD